jgi:hypothetical protein
VPHEDAWTHALGDRPFRLRRSMARTTSRTHFVTPRAPINFNSV